MTIDEAIRELIGEDAITDQATLQERLAGRGHSVTQPTLSRHLRRLGVRKVNGVYRHEERSGFSVPNYELKPVPPNLLVLKTVPGHAQVLAVRLDGESIEGMAGCVAGDDTVFIAGEGSLDGLAERVRAVLAAPG